MSGNAFAMNQPQAKPSWSPRTVLAVSVVLSVILGASAGLAAGFLTRTSPKPQSREFFLFPFELEFNASTAKGLTSSYIFIPERIIVNKGDTVIIRFYDTSDDSHTFTMEAPYMTDVVLAAATLTAIQNQTITLVTSTSGMFTYHCRFHPPQMLGTLIVQG